MIFKSLNTTDSVVNINELRITIKRQYTGKILPINSWYSTQRQFSQATTKTHQSPSNVLTTGCGKGLCDLLNGYNVIDDEQCLRCREESKFYSGACTTENNQKSIRELFWYKKKSRYEYKQICVWFILRDIVFIK